MEPGPTPAECVESDLGPDTGVTLGPAAHTTADLREKGAPFPLPREGGSCYFRPMLSDPEAVRIRNAGIEAGVDEQLVEHVIFCDMPFCTNLRRALLWIVERLDAEDEDA
jgi:hypothetical protein